jgi:hypothetical protein
MVQPIQYTVKAPSAFESLVSGLKLGTSLQEMQAQRALREQQALQIQQNMEQKRQQQEALNAIRSARPEDMTQEFVNRYTGLIPAEQQRLMQEQFNRYDTQRQNVLAGQYGQMAQMAFSGVDDAQVNGFFDQLIAAQDSESAKKALEVERKAFLSAPDKDLYGKQKLYMLTGLGEKGKDVADQVRALNKAKTESLSSDELKKRRADADEAVAKAITAQAEARTAPEKQAADLAKAQAEAAQMAAGVIPADKRPEAERNFRNEYNDRTKVYQDVKASYGRVLSSDDSAVGDLSLIFGYMKMLDPGSVVREGEFATAQNAAGVPDRVMNVYNRIVSGERLNSDQRKAFKGQAERLFKQAGQQEAQVRSGIERIAKDYGLNTANIFYTPEDVAPVAPGAAASAPAPTPRPAPAPPTGGRNIGGGFRVLD